MITPLIPKILILENHMIIAADVSLQFSKLGYEVIGILPKLEEALETIEANRPDIILFNIEMEGIVAGLELASFISNTMEIPLVYLSTYSNQAFFKEKIDTLPYAFIPKPFNRLDLKGGIETTLRRMIAEGWGAKLKKKPLHRIIPLEFNCQPFGRNSIPLGQ